MAAEQCRDIRYNVLFETNEIITGYNIVHVLCIWDKWNYNRVLNKTTATWIIFWVLTSWIHPTSCSLITIHFFFPCLPAGHSDARAFLPQHTNQNNFHFFKPVSPFHWRCQRQNQSNNQARPAQLMNGPSNNFSSGIWLARLPQGGKEGVSGR